MNLQGVNLARGYRNAANPFSAQSESSEDNTEGSTSPAEHGASDKQAEPLSVTEAIALANKNLKKLPLTLIGEVSAQLDL